LGTQILIWAKLLESLKGKVKTLLPKSCVALSEPRFQPGLCVLKAWEARLKPCFRRVE